MTWASAAVWTGLLSSLQAGTSDFVMRPERWETRAVLSSVENVLKNPLSGPAAVDALGARVGGAEGSAGLIAAGFDSLGVTPANSSEFDEEIPLTPAGVPKEISKPVQTLVGELTRALREQKLAVSSLSSENRVRALRAASAAVGDDAFAPREGEDFDAADRFDMTRAAAAGLAATRAADEAIAEFTRSASTSGPAFDRRWDSPIGKVIVSSGDAEFGPEELAAAGLIVRLGGRTHYRGPAAAAGEGQIRVVIDLGGPAVVESSAAAAGSGEFGIGLLYLLGPGPHSVNTGPHSLGSGRFGVGYALVGGSSSTLTSRRFGQGAAAYGVGALDTRGDGLTLKVPMAGQGYGTTRGAGIWRHRGARISATCGFAVADAREHLGSVSMGQGAGMGPRAFAAGGIGVAHVTGDDARLDGSYFAQGAGYWRGLGALFVRGDGARLQSRRYGLGTGTHAAVGALDVEGKRAQIKAWGVGPGFGWDYGVGLFRLRGDEAKLRSDWATGRSDLGSRSLTWIESDRAELALATLGTGSFTRGESGYGLAVIRGDGVRLRSPGLAVPLAVRGPADLLSAAGAIHVDGTMSLDPALSLPDPSWPAPNRDARGAAEAANTARLLSPPKNESPRARLARQLFAASADIVDPRPVEGAARALTALTSEEAPILASLLDADRFDELVWARLGASGLGPAAARAGLAESAAASGPRRAALFDWLRFGRAADAVGPCEALLRDPDWRMRRQAVSVLGGLFSNDDGDESGRRRFLREAAAGTASPERVRGKHLSDLYIALALGGTPTPDERVELLEKARTPFDSADPEAVRAFAGMISSSSVRVAALAREETETAALDDRARGDLRLATDDPDDEVASAALLALGGLLTEKDAPTLAAALSSRSALRREAAATGLGRMGPGARAALEGVFKSGDARARALAARAAAQSWSPDVFLLLHRALADPDASVRSAAIGGLAWASSPVSSKKKELLADFQRLAEKDGDAGVRASAALAAASISPAKVP
ncbi:MAG: hypothetical protein ACHQ49_10200 [Elusimicrobiota bacterium]